MRALGPGARAAGLSAAPFPGVVTAIPQGVCQSLTQWTGPQVRSDRGTELRNCLGDSDLDSERIGGWAGAGSGPSKSGFRSCPVLTPDMRHNLLDTDRSKG